MIVPPVEDVFHHQRNDLVTQMYEGKVEKKAVMSFLFDIITDMYGIMRSETVLPPEFHQDYVFLKLNLEHYMNDREVPDDVIGDHTIPQRYDMYGLHMLIYIMTKFQKTLRGEHMLFTSSSQSFFRLIPSFFTYIKHRGQDNFKIDDILTSRVMLYYDNVSKFRFGYPLRPTN